MAQIARRPAWLRNGSNAQYSRGNVIVDNQLAIGTETPNAGDHLTIYSLDEVVDVFLTSGSHEWRISTFTGGAFVLSYNDSEKFRINSNGNCGIGSSLPLVRLDIADGAMEFEEISDPGNGDSNTCRLYSRDNGSGKSQLCAVFGSGAVQVLATEP